jgi:hypothetical protein
MQNEHNFLIVGLPEAGKTSFIHALDDVLQNPPSRDALCSYGLAEDRSYLERDKAKFRAGKKLDHTERNLQGPAPELWFEHPESGQRGRVFLPDVNGEVFQDQWVDRRWSTSFRDALKTIDGMLVFVRADTPASNQELLGQMILLLPLSQKPALSFQPKKASAQVQLVDVLQFIAIKGEVVRPLKVAVLISAWDTVEKPGNLQPKTPSAFLLREWALLYQYLRSNHDVFVTKIYGVSALGGTEEELKELRKLPPHDRVKLVEDDHCSKDLTRPIRWLLSLS